MKTWVEVVYMGQEFAVNNIVYVYGSESRFAIHDDPGAGSRSTIRDPKIVTSLLLLIPLQNISTVLQVSQSFIRVLQSTGLEKYFTTVQYTIFKYLYLYLNGTGKILCKIIPRNIMPLRQNITFFNIKHIPSYQNCGRIRRIIRRLAHSAFRINRDPRNMLPRN